MVGGSVAERLTTIRFLFFACGFLFGVHYVEPAHAHLIFLSEIVADNEPLLNQ
jgi:hypothetical protein